MKTISSKVAKLINDLGYSQNNSTIPTYIEIWLWLCNKNIIIYPEECLGKWAVFELGCHVSRDGYIYNSPEEAIISSIEYLTENNLIIFNE